MLELVGLKERMHSKIRTYSKGMKQRVGIAQALLHDPDVLFLDEPTDGVDPVGRREIREILQKLKVAGKTIFLNSHLLSEVEMICDRVAIMELGKVVQAGDVESLTRQKGRYHIGLAKGHEFPADEARGQGFQVKAAKDSLWEVMLTSEQTIDPIVDLLRSRGVGIRYLVEKRQTLEDIFIATVDTKAGEA
jgi:ABC-2 type transport system ATP-binding protein